MTEEKANKLGVHICHIARRWDDGYEGEAFRELLKITANLIGELRAITRQSEQRKEDAN